MKNRTLDELKNLIANAQLEKVINDLINKSKHFKKEYHINNQLSKEILLISSRFKLLKGKHRQGVINEMDFNLEINKINLSLISLIEDLENKKNSGDVLSSPRNSFKTYLILAFISLILFSTFYIFNNKTKNSLEPKLEEREKKYSSKDIDSKILEIDNNNNNNNILNEKKEKNESKKDSLKYQPNKKGKPKTPTEIAYLQSLEEGLLLLDMQNYELAIIKLKEAISISPQSIEARNAKDWVYYIQNSDELYSGVLPKENANKFYARCLIPDMYEIETTKDGKEVKNIIKEGGPSKWVEVVCGKAFYLTKLNQSTIIKIQSKLRNEGFYFGPIDGKLSKFLFASIKVYHRDASCLSTNPLDCVFIPKDYIASTFFQAIGIEPNK